MKLYLSSYKFGNQIERLRDAAPRSRIGYIQNALDFTGVDLDRKDEQAEVEMETLRDLGLGVELLDLRHYFGKRSELKEKLDDLGAVFLCGGNVFVLRQAMKLSGLDQLLIQMNKESDFLYAGYSAAGCVLAPTLEAYRIVDDATDTPYDALSEALFDGLGIVEFCFMPHWDSDHPESKAIEDEIAYCKRNDIPYKAIRDGEVLLLDGNGCLSGV